jgi:hypothetical protein
LDYLESLNLYGTEVSDAGLEHLAGLPNLRRLYAWETGISREGAAEFIATNGKVDINLGYEVNVIDSLTVEVKPVAVNN